MLRRSILRRDTLLRGKKRLGLSFTVGSTYDGFEYVGCKPIPELHIIGHRFIHNETKTRYFHFDTDDTNNSFCMGFCTPAENDKGTTHVLEHTVLCGSKKYPIRDPFFMMLRRSMSTFMNAMTGADYTLYPFSTTNPADFSNLLNVYLDSCLNPLLRAEDFRQEGHRVEVIKGEEGAESGDRRAQYNGVVFNEMRGVVSEPQRFFMQELQREMLPGTHYQHLSGGFPTDILDLTHEELTAFHAKHYHPTNGVVMTYGDLHPRTHMATLNAAFTGRGEGQRVKVAALDSAHRRDEPRVVKKSGPTDLMGDASKQRRIITSYALPEGTNELQDVVRLSVLEQLLTQGPSSSMYAPLIESQIGSKFAPMTGYAYYYSTPLLSFGVDGASQVEGDKNVDQVKDAVQKTLGEVVDKGFDQRRVDSIVFQEELQQLHRSTSYGVGLTTSLSVLTLLREGSDPMDFLNWVPHLKAIAKDAKKELCPLLKKTTLDNHHTTTFVVDAGDEYLNNLQATIEDKNKKLDASLSEDEKDKIEKQSAEWLERVRAPQDASVLPTLTVADIPKNGVPEPTPVPMSDGKTFLIPSSTNGLVYVSGFVPLFQRYADTLISAAKGDSTAIDRISTTPLMYALYGKTGTREHNFKDFSVEVDNACSGFSFGQSFTNVQTDKSEFVCGTTFGFYTTKEKLRDALMLLYTSICMPDVGNVAKSRDEVRSRIQSITKARASRKIQGVQMSGNAFALKRACAATGMPASILSELHGGLTQVDVAEKQLAAMQNPDTSKAALDEIVMNYGMFCESFAARLVADCTFWASCEENDMHWVEASINEFREQVAKALGPKVAQMAGSMMAPSRLKLNASQVEASKNKFAVESGSSNISLPIDTGFVGTAIPNNNNFGDKDQQVMRVATQIAKNEFLHRAVREEGGAYGAQCAANFNGTAGGVTMASYRDPTPEKTVESFAKVSEWISNPDNVTAERVEQSKLRLFAAIDAPMSPDQYGGEYFLSGTTHEMLEDARQKLLAVTAEDVIRVAPKLFSAEGQQTVSLVPQKKE